MIRHELYKIIKNGWLYWGIILAIAVSILGLLENGMVIDSFADRVHPANQSAMVFYSQVAEAYTFCLLPIMVAMVGGDSFAAESRSHIREITLGKVSLGRYLASKCIAVGIIGFCLAVLPLVLNQIYCLIAFPLHNEMLLGGRMPWEISEVLEDLLLPGLFIQSPYLLNVITILISGLYGALLAVIAVAFTTLYNQNMILVRLFPFLLMTVVMAILNVLGSNDYVLQYYCGTYGGISGRSFPKLILLFCIYGGGAGVTLWIGSRFGGHRL